jgi:hypothetical protein
MRLAPVAYKPLPNLQAYQARLVALTGASNGARQLGELANLADPLAVAARARATPVAGSASGSLGGLQSPAPGPVVPAMPQIEMPDIAAALKSAADEIRSAVGGNGSGGAAEGNAVTRPRIGMAEPVLPLSSVEEQMRQPHADGGGPLMQGVYLGVLQRLQQVQTAQAAVAVAAQQQVQAQAQAQAQQQAQAQAQRQAQHSQNEAQEGVHEGSSTVPAPNDSCAAAALSSSNLKE